MEVFKSVVGYEGLYTVSNYGRIYSLQKNKFLRSKSNGRGYLQVMLTKGKEHKMLYVHRIVAEAFLDNDDSLNEVNHKDENVQNNHVDNLEWCSKKYNLSYGTRIERIVQHFKKSVAQIDMDGNVVRIFDSLSDAERIFGYNHSNVSNCCNGKIPTAYGYKWRFV